jgi:hypothetical protein
MTMTHFVSISGTIYYSANAGMTDDRPPIIRQKAGATRWDTETIINYDFFPKGWIDGPVGPILVYFKETQTPADSWNEGPGKLASDTCLCIMQCKFAQVVIPIVSVFPSTVDGRLFDSFGALSTICRHCMNKMKTSVFIYRI